MRTRRRVAAAVAGTGLLAGMLGLAAAEAGSIPTAQDPTYFSPIAIRDANQILTAPGGNVVAVGWAGRNYDPTPGAYDFGPGGEVAVQSLDATGQLRWRARVGGPGADNPPKVTVDDNGNVYLSAMTRSRNFPMTDGALGAGYWDEVQNQAFYLMKLNRNGRLLWSARLPGISNLGGLDVGRDGSVFVGGSAAVGATASSGAADSSRIVNEGYVAKVSPTGTRYLWTTFLGGSASDFVGDVKVTPGGAVAVWGGTDSADFPVTPAAAVQTLPGESNAGFVAKLTPDGDAVTWASYFGYAENEYYSQIGVSADGRVDVLGFSEGFFGTRPPNGHPNPGGLLIQFRADGSGVKRIETVLVRGFNNFNRNGEIVGFADDVGPSTHQLAVRLSFDGTLLSFVRLPGSVYAATVDGGSTYASMAAPVPGDTLNRLAATRRVNALARYTRCTIKGNAGNNVLRGTPRADVICGFGGNDTIYGLGGADVLIGGAGADRLYGGSGVDVLLGGTGPDALFGGRGRDLMRGGDGNDHCADRLGNNTFRSC